MVRFFGIIRGHAQWEWLALIGPQVQEAIQKTEVKILPKPFGLKQQVANNVQLQTAVIKDVETHHTIPKHVAFPAKMRPSWPDLWHPLPGKIHEFQFKK